MTVNATSYDYHACLVLKNGAIEFISMPEGRVLPPGPVVQNDSEPYIAGDTTNTFWRYEYQLKEHLGNLRLACRCAERATATAPDQGYPVHVVQQASYDPWGVILGLNTTENGEPSDRYRYNAKEFQKDHGLYDYGARMYDPSIGKFSSVDPLAHIYPSISPYAYVLNNPIRFIDPGGRAPFDNYKLLENGEVKLTQKTNDKFDKLTASNGNTLIINKSDKNDATIISNLSTKDSKGFSSGTTSSATDARNTYNFLNENTTRGVEFGLVGFSKNDSTQYSVSTMHENSGTSFSKIGAHQKT